ncbi:pentachlorophenol monooxygenase [Rugosimonospora africana]|uniref:Pentachlorophenol monooxygenase n=2 Tax=Rugosimonospora africana TaxID=556532 RepID=A0A8J3QQG5_9ACTN|nr:pentachlorophenol monooxygenase [Rugosimonospora africana]
MSERGMSERGMSERNTDVDEVIVAGGGPTGLTVAAALAHRGVPVTVLEAAPALSTEWRASTFHPPTLELLKELDVVDEMVSRGLVADKYQIRDRVDGLIAEFDLSVLAEDTEFPFRLQLEQYKFAEMLAERMERHPLCTIHYGHSVESVEDDGDVVTVTARLADGTPVTRRARYVIGADGARSAVRKSLRIPFSGHTYPVRFLILSTTSDFAKVMPDICYVNYIWDPVEPMMLLRIPDVWRVLFSIGPDEQEGDLLEPESLRRRVAQVTPERGFDVLSAQYYSVHQRVADTFRSGRVLLIGDAAHVNSPVGGLGLNSGVHDAFDLAIRLARHLRDGAAPEILDEYASRRREIALEFVRRVTHRNTTMMIEQQAEAREKNRREMRAIAESPERQREWLLESSMISGVRMASIGH